MPDDATSQSGVSVDEARFVNHLFDAYVAPPGGYDEVRDTTGKTRDHWKQAIAMFQGLAVGELQSRCKQVERHVADLGLSYRIYNDATLSDRLATPDCIPLILSQNEWTQIGAGLQQRARLLELIIKDIYGPQRLIKEGVIPPEIIFANPLYLRPCVGLEPIGNRYLHVYAADMLRAPDGAWTVITDRTQSPSGAGFALEHRRALLRVFPEFLRKCQVRGILPYISRFRSGLADFAPGQQDPRVVLLTPGPYHESYYEHALLCKAFGYTLAEGGDLTVRGSKVYLKVLEGLLPVDLILRRVDDLFCDPLELQPDSVLSPPGIVEALRNRGVGMINALGTGICHTPALLPFLPGACRKLLGEELVSKTVATWWCGQKTERDYVLANLKHLVIKPSMSAQMFDPVFCGSLTTGELAELRDRILASPGAFVAQEYLSGSTIPVLSDYSLKPARLQMRCFLSVENGDYTLMPGGAVRYTVDSPNNVISVQSGAGSKDAWIISDDASDNSDEGITSRGAQVLQRSAGSIPSRVADNFFWLGRQIDRIESCVRLSRMLLHRVSDLQTDSLSPELRVLVETLLFARLPQKVDARSAIAMHLFDPGAACGLRPAIREVMRLARNSRDRLGSDLFRVIRRIDAATHANFSPNNPPDPTTVISTLNNLVLYLSSFHGLVLESMTHTPSWRFLDLGRRIERATEMIRLLKSTMVDATLDESSILSAVLESTDCPLTYRQLYFAAPRTSAVADLLLSDADNPRSVHYAGIRILGHLTQLPRSASEPLSPLRRTVQKLVSTCELYDMLELCEPAASGQRDLLARALSDLNDKIRQITELITQNFFSHAVVRQQSSAAEVRS